MTVGELSRRTGLSIKAIRQYEALGLIYSAGRSDGNYRLFDESALWCAQDDRDAALARADDQGDRPARQRLPPRPDESIGPALAAALDAAERRIDERIAELAAVRGRIRDYRAQNAAALAGRGGDLFGSDPRRRGGLTLPPG